MMKIKNLIIILVMFISLFLVTGCSTRSNYNVTITTTIFPLYDFTRQITQDKLSVKMILPPGNEPHTYQLKPQDILTIRKSKLFIYTGPFLEVWVDKLIDVLDEDKVLVVNVSDNLELHHEDDDDHDHKHHHDVDPHIWVDPILAQKIVDNILENIIKIDPDNADFYRQNASNYKQELVKLDLAYQDLFTKIEHKTIIFGGHFVFGYLAERYGVEHVSPYKGFSPDTLPTTKNLQNLVKVIETTGNRTIFYEELINPEVAEIIAKETGAKLLPLNGAGYITKADFESGVTYLDLMYQNIENLKKGLNYHE